MSEQFPSDEPTRMGPPEGQDVPPPTAPGSWPPPPQQPAAWPNQPPAGSWPAPGQQPPANPYGPPAGTPGAWGPPQGPGGPAGPGGPGGPQGPWGPPNQPPSGGGRKGLVIGAVLLVLLLVGGGIAAAVALSGDDDGDDGAKGSEETSQTEDPTEATSEDVEGTTAGTSGPSFEATNFDEVSRVCQGEAMSNAAAWDPAAPVALPFFNSPEEPEVYRSMPLGASQSWTLKEYGAFETTNLVICAEGTPSATAEVQQCTDEDGSYEWHPYDWAVSLRAAATGEVLGELDPYLEEQTGCPSWAVVDEDRTAHTMPDTGAIESAIGAWLVQAGSGESGEDGQTGAAPFEATSMYDLARVCLGGAATNQPAFDPKTAKGIGALNTEKEPNYGGNLSIGTLDKWAADYRSWQKVSFIVCADGQPSATVKPRKCKASQEKKKGRFDFVQFDYTLTVREVATGEVLTELDTLVPEFDSCPMFAFLDEDNVYTPSPDSSEIREQVNAWLAQEGGRK